MLIAISGTPGTGKSTVAKELAKRLKLKLFSLNELAKERNLIIGYDKKRESWIIDVERLKELKFSGIVEGHLAHFLDADVLIILRCRPSELIKRLAKRGWSKEKIRENAEAELLGVISSEAEELGKEFFEVDTTSKSTEQVVEEILRIIRGRAKKRRINFLNEEELEAMEKAIEELQK